ncbi:uncharacterized mitochondrial protein AtMg00310-like [Coffea arabica]|uniref:Uncharacterized mitochondrial protein AtMg00310-like n=1 Tax=Coffea arabica TaxID=13443 RepID=A0ABM4UQX8_COFAR
MDARRVHWFSRDKLCYPIAEGGLGFKSFDNMCSAFTCKLWWWLRANDSIWAKFMHQKYVKRVHPNKAAVCRPSLSWRRLVTIREMVERQIRWCLGRGFVDFWHDRWLGKETVAERVGVHDPTNMLAAEFVVHNEWNVSKLL